MSWIESSDANVASSVALPCSKGRALDIVLGKHGDAGRRVYDIGWWSSDHSPRPKPPLCGRGWHVAYRVIQYRGPDPYAVLGELMDSGHLETIPTADVEEKFRGRTKRWQSVPELLIYAPDLHVARRAANMILAAYVLLDAQILVTDEITALPLDPDEYEGLSTIERYRESKFLMASDLARAAALAAKLSHRRAHTYACFKYFQSLRVASVPWIETEPREGRKYGIEKEPYAHVLYSQAIIIAYSCLEELGLELRASSKNPSFVDGKTWNPKVKTHLEARLEAAGVNIDDDFGWVVRGTPTLIERKARKLAGPKARWADGQVRDRHIPLVDAVATASWLRSKVSAHKLSTLTRSLTIYDVLNVQMLARRLILEAVGEWRKMLAE